MQDGPLKILICGRWQHCSKVIRWSGVCYCAVLSVVWKVSEAKGYVSVEQRIIIKFLTKEGCKQSDICSRLKKQYGEKTLSNVSVHKWSSAFKKGRETVENEPHKRRPRTSITGENRDGVDALIRENRRITVRELSGILNISDGSVKTIIKHHWKFCRRQTFIIWLHDAWTNFAPICTDETWVTGIERWNKLFRAASCVKAWARDRSASEVMFYNYAQM